MVAHTKRAHWQHTTRRANMCFEAESFTLAHKYYHKALSLAYELFLIPHEYKHSIVAITISHHNLADLFIQKNKPQQASRHLHHAHDFMRQEFYQVKCDYSRRELLRLLNITQIELKKFQHLYGFTQPTHLA